jgi:hypothetical protein
MQVADTEMPEDQDGLFNLPRWQIRAAILIGCLAAKRQSFCSMLERPQRCNFSGLEKAAVHDLVRVCVNECAGDAQRMQQAGRRSRGTKGGYGGNWQPAADSQPAATTIQLSAPASSDGGMLLPRGVVMDAWRA